MKKTEIVYRLVCEKFMRGQKKFTQAELAKEAEISLSTVNAAIRKLDKISAAKLHTRGFEVTAFDRLIIYWATRRDLDKDICYKTRSDMPIARIEASMPAHIAFTAYTAYKYSVGEVPADYSQVYVYSGAEGLNEIKRRFPPKTGIPNLMILSADDVLDRSIEEGGLTHNSVSLPQIFVDLWNIKNWYSKEFIDKLKEKLKI